jgi:hypothetical protein
VLLSPYLGSMSVSLSCEFPDVVAKGADQSLKTGSSIQRWSDDIKLQPVTIGMDVLRRLHVYLAFKEDKMHITAARPPALATNAVVPDNNSSGGQ